jgi:hypothetical protein
MSWSEVTAGMCAGYMFVMRRKKWPKYAILFRCGACSVMEFSMETTFFAR